VNVNTSVLLNVILWSLLHAVFVARLELLSHDWKRVHCSAYQNGTI